MLKKLPLLFLILLFAMCKSKKNVTTGSSEDKKKEKIYYTEQIRDDFRSVSQKTQNKFLKDYKANTEEYAILFFTKGFNGEEITVKNEEGEIYKGIIFSDKESGLAKNMRIKSNIETEIYDKETKKKIYIKPESVGKHKFIYIMKETGSETPYKITYSNKLRPAK